MRHYYKYPCCLSVYVFESEARHGSHCGHCEDRLTYMGYVHQDRDVLEKKVEACPCDARCTNALGPSCNCKCGGVNHGSNLVVSFDKVVGKTPKPTDDRNKKNYELAEWLLDWKEKVTLQLSFTPETAYRVSKLLKIIFTYQTWTKRFQVVKQINEKLSRTDVLPSTTMDEHAAEEL